MEKKFSKLYIILIATAFFVGGYFLGGYQKEEQSIQNITTQSEFKENNSDNTFRFHNFHGQDLGTSGFEFEYPTGWHNDGQYFSPQKITYYDILSTDAPVYYDLISDALIETSDLKYQIVNDKKYKPDSEVTIDGKKFKKYDLLDYQSEGQNRVIIYVGPKISIYEAGYYLVFRWEEKPLGLSIPGNDPKVFEQMVSTLKFTK